MITEEKLPEVKKQLIEQIGKTFPEEKRTGAIQQIEGMSAEQLQGFLEQNNLIPKEGESTDSQCIFCAIVKGQMPSTKITENDKAIAILEINPISKGHTLIIPKDHITKPEDLPQEAKDLAKTVSEKLQKLKPKDFVVSTQNILGHEIINVIPVYTDETAESPRNKETPEGLAKVAEELEVVPISLDQKEIKVIEETKPEPVEEKDLPIWKPRVP